jgi:Fur family ferric uptake transcriptional regulator
VRIAYFEKILKVKVLGRRVFIVDNTKLRTAGLKITLPRIKILEILENADPHHLSAEDVYKVLLETGHDVAFATVYRVLTQFEEARLVKRHNFEGGHSVFELAQNEHHDHLVCVKCSRVEEFVDDLIEMRQMEIAKKAHFRVTDHSLTIYGVCRDCHKSPLVSD